MEASATSLSGVPLLVVRGDVDHVTSSALERAAQEALDGLGPRLLFDLSQCRYLDSGGISVFLKLLRDLKPDGWLGVIGADTKVRRVFEIVGLTAEHRFCLFATREEALKAIESASSS